MPGILVGYARTSTCEQQAGLDAQVRDLKAAGCEEIFSEQVSAVAQRDRLRKPCGSSAEVIRSWLQAGSPCQEHHRPAAYRGRP